MKRQTAKAAGAVYVIAIILASALFYLPSERPVAGQECTDWWCSISSAISSATETASSYYSSYTSSYSSYTDTLSSVYSSYSSSYTSYTDTLSSQYSSFTESASSYSSSLTETASSIYSSYTSATQSLSSAYSSIYSSISESYPTMTEEISSWIATVQHQANISIANAVQLAEANSGVFSDVAWTVISVQVGSSFARNYSSVSKVHDLYARRGLVTEATCLAVRFVPIYNDSTGQALPFDTVARQMVSSNPQIASSDFGKDPVRTGCLMAMDSKYLNYAKIIQGPNGKWMSINQAMATGYRTDEVLQAKNNYDSARQALDSNDPQQAETNMKVFSNQIAGINASPQANSVLPGVPDYVLFVLAVVVLALLSVAVARRRHPRRSTDKGVVQSAGKEKSTHRQSARTTRYGNRPSKPDFDECPFCTEKGHLFYFKDMKKLYCGSCGTYFDRPQIQLAAIQSSTGISEFFARYAEDKRLIDSLSRRRAEGTVSEETYNKIRAELEARLHSVGSQLHSRVSELRNELANLNEQKKLKSKELEELFARHSVGLLSLSEYNQRRNAAEKESKNLESDIKLIEESLRKVNEEISIPTDKAELVTPDLNEKTGTLNQLLADGKIGEETYTKLRSEIEQPKA